MADTLTAPDMVSRSTWADAYRTGHPETGNWHFVDIEIDDGNMTACYGYPASLQGQASAGPANDCVVHSGPEGAVGEGRCPRLVHRDLRRRQVGRLQPALPAGCQTDSSPVSLPAGYDAQAQTLAALQLQRAGVRLASELNRALGK